MRIIRLTLLVILISGTAEFCFGIDEYSPGVTLYGGAGAAHQEAAIRGSFQYGISMSAYSPYNFSGFLMEFGYASPLLSKDPRLSAFKGAATISPLNYMAAFKTHSSGRLPDRLSSLRMPIFFTAGYSRFIGAGNGINYGVGMDFRFNETRAIRFEVRDYWKLTGAGTREHNAAFRLGCVFFVED